MICRSDMTYKRYEYWVKGGKAWSSWFPWHSDMRDKWQMKNKLMNEYKEE